MNLPSISDLKIKGKKVLLRTNYDVPLEKGKVIDPTRIEESLSTVNYLLNQDPEEIIILSHLGRPEGKIVPKLGLKPVACWLADILKLKVNKPRFRLKNFSGFKLGEKIVLLENLRFFPEEEKNDFKFAKELASLADFYVNEAFACSHRAHASIVGVPSFFSFSQKAFGFDFLKEVEVLSKVRQKPERPLVLLLGGEKKDKIEYAKKLVKWADWILVGGRLIEYDEIPNILAHPKIVGSLIKDGQDITIETAKKFAEIIRQAKTVVWAGPMGNFYQEGHERGTKIIAETIVESGVFSVVGGGDTEVALSRFGLTGKINFISSGGGAMLEFLAEGTLPGIKAILEK